MGNFESGQGAIMKPILILLLFLVGCASWQDNAAKTLSAAQVLGAQAFDIARAELHKKCLAIAKECPANDLKTCEPWVICDAERVKVFNALKLYQQGVKAAAEIVPTVAKLKGDR